MMGKEKNTVFRTWRLYCIFHARSDLYAIIRRFPSSQNIRNSFHLLSRSNILKLLSTIHQKDTAIRLAFIFVLEVSTLFFSPPSKGRKRSSSSMRSNLLARIETRERKIDGLISLSSKNNNNLAMVLQMAFCASVSSEANGNTPNKLCRKFKSATNQS
ncbi:lipid-transfer protein [Striga asiatica]|uniref:Lipid-transfer protein n=1 Tax=Striga asiatica TaxID=4170 RepID=A0A5A7Q3T7_STRAF|nr:lipid-transfer protein [Striga asiatica]